MEKFTKIRDVVTNETNWVKQKTTRRCIQPPKSERIFTLWLEGKIVFGDVIDGSDVEDKKNGHEYHDSLISCALLMLHGEERDYFPYKEARNIITDDGVPVHGLKYNISGIEFTEETFCDTERKSSCYIKYTLRNTLEIPKEQKFTLAVRSGKEMSLISGDGCDQYGDYTPIDDDCIFKIHPTWNFENNVYTDKERYLTQIEGDAPVWNEQEGYLDFDFKLAPGEEKEISFILNKGENVTKDYNKAKENTENFWRKELSRLNKIPTSWTEKPETLKMVRHFTAQMLQCFMYSVGKDYLLFRQGGMRRIIFPGEVCWNFEAMSQIGDFSDYLEDTLDTYFNVMQVESGEIINIGIYWAMITGVCLYSYAKYCVHNGEKGKKCFHKYRENALKGLSWIMKTRRETIGDEKLAQGLFPALRSCDWEEVFQAWLTSDANIILGVEALAEAFEKFKDPAADMIRNEANDYKAAFARYVIPHAEKAKDSDELYIPLCPTGKDDAFVNGGFPVINHGVIGMLGILGEEDMEKIHRAMVRTGRAYKGLYGGMYHKPMGGLMWYTSAPEYRWFVAYKKFNNREKMQEILDYQLKYFITDEYTMQERYIETVEYFTPWSPNASAMARTILMMLALEEK